MINSRVKRCQVFAAPLLGVCVTLATAVSAQAPLALPSATQPTQESEPAVSAPQPLSSPRALLPRQQNRDEDETSAPVANTVDDRQIKSGIQIDGLGQIDYETVGVLSPQDGGLGNNLWQGLTRTQAVSLIAGLPDTSSSPALRDLTVRLLLSRAQAPVSAADAPPSLLVARAQALAAMGDADALMRLMAAAPSQGRPVGLDRADAVLSLLTHDNARVCGLARNNLAAAAEDFWQRLLVYCDAIDGKSESVTLGLSLLRESAGDDPVLVLLTDALLNKSSILIDAIEQPNLVHLALSRTADVALPEFVDDTTSLMVLRGASQALNLSLGARIDAAERAVEAGILGVDALRQLYTQVPFAPADIADALRRADETGGAAARALLYQAAVGNNIPVARAEIITQAFEVAREDNRYMAAVQAFQPLMDRLPPSPEMAWFALTGFRAYVSVGEVVGAERWLALLRASASVRPEAQLALERVRPLAWLLGARDPGVSVEQVLRDWHASVADQPELGPARDLLNGLFLALGTDVPTDLWPSDTAARSQTMPPAALWFRFRDSLARYAASAMSSPAPRTASLNAAAEAAVIAVAPSSNGVGKAEPLLLFLQTMGSVPAAQLGPAVIYDAITALRTLDEEDTARRLAVEIALAAGL